MERARGSEKGTFKTMIIHGFTTRSDGDMKKSEENRKKIIRKLFGSDRQILVMAQKHSNTVGIDSLVSERKDVALAVFAADCVPLLLTDGNLIAAVHAGWKGTLGGITTNTVKEMKSQGCRLQDIRAWIGPHIGMCHYDMPKERAEQFLLYDDSKAVSFFENRWHVDIGWTNYRQLLDAGVKLEHISAPITCTACQTDTYFSFRKEKNKLAGEIMGVIGHV